MKYKFIALFAFVAFALMAFNYNEFEAGSTGGTYTKEVANATVNTEKDTIVLSNLLSNYQLTVALKGTSVSGTYNVKGYLDESVFLSGTTNWRVIDSTSTTTVALATIRQADTYARRYRVRLVGTGTQSSTTAVAIFGKKKN